MSPRVCFGVVAIALILSATAGLVLWGALRSSSSYHSLRQQAIESGVPLTLPKTIVNAHSTRLSKSASKEYAFVSSAYTAETIEDVRSLTDLAKGTHKILHEIAEFGPGKNRWTPEHRRALHQVSNLCLFAAWIALGDNRDAAFFGELQALRNLITVFPVTESDSASTQTYLLQAYCGLSQFAAEHARSEVFVRSLIEDAEKLPDISYHLAATNVTAEILEEIDLQQLEHRAIADGEHFDLAGTIDNAEPSMNKRRAEAIEAGLFVIGKWDRLHDVLQMRKRYDTASFVLARLKESEVLNALRTRALRATLRAHIHRTRGEPFPTMQSLEREGFSVSDPRDDERFEWSTTTPKRMTYPEWIEGKPYRREVITPAYNLKSKWGAELVSRLRAKR